MLRHAVILLLAILVSFSASAFTVVIDAGHGGKDVGSSEQGVLEKDVCLDVALIVGRMLSANKGVKVVYTRTTDVFVDLQRRAAIANEEKADVLLSIHCNSMSDNTAGRERYKGTVTYILGPDGVGQNLDVTHRETTVQSLESNYTTHYETYDYNSDESHIIYEMSQQQNMQQSLGLAQNIQRHMVKVAGRDDAGVYQASYVVLARAAMPAALVELDYLSNADSRAFLTSPEGATLLARALCAALQDTFLH